jgi:hypothetical protein
MIIEADGELCMWIIFERPRDAPELYIARLFRLDQPMNTVIYGDTLDEVRELLAKLYPGLTCLPRNPGDEVHVVETWL